MWQLCRVLWLISRGRNGNYVTYSNPHVDAWFSILWMLKC